MTVFDAVFFCLKAEFIEMDLIQFLKISSSDVLICNHRFGGVFKMYSTSIVLIEHCGAIRDRVRGPGPRDAALRTSSGLLPRRGVHVLSQQVYA